MVGAVFSVGLRVAMLGGAALAAYLLLTLLDGAAHADRGAGSDAGIAGISQAVTVPLREVSAAVTVQASAPAGRVVAGAKESRDSQKKTAREIVRVRKAVTRHVPQPPRLLRQSAVDELLHPRQVGVGVELEHDDASGAGRDVVTSVQATVSEALPGNATPPRLPLPGAAVDDQATSDDPVAGQVIDMLGGPGAPGDSFRGPSPLPPAPPVAAAPSVGPPATWSPVVDVAAVTPPPAPVIVPAEPRSGDVPDHDRGASEGASSGRTVGGGDPPGGFALAGRPQWGPEITRGAALARPGDNRHGRRGAAVPPPPK
ncbi:hypothetical protein ACVCAH_33855 [Micromonospora sp. LZ34]